MKTFFTRLYVCMSLDITSSLRSHLNNHDSSSNWLLRCECRVYYWLLHSAVWVSSFRTWIILGACITACCFDIGPMLAGFWVWSNLYNDWEMHSRTQQSKPQLEPWKQLELPSKYLCWWVGAELALVAECQSWLRIKMFRQFNSLQLKLASKNPAV